MKVVITALSWTRSSLTYHGGTAKQQKAVTRLIDDALAVDIPGSHFIAGVRSGMWDGRRHLFYTGSNTFPTGLKPRVKRLLKEAGYRVVTKSLCGKRPPVDLSVLKPTMLKGITLRDYQLKSARRALERGHGILWLTTNAGTT
jgi:hypothetical protein